MEDLLADLNPPQREAVLHEEGPLLVLAGAGSGKTRVITRRIAHLILEREVPAWKILAVTFTNKAAREMRERLTSLLGASASGLTVSTFHSAAAMILRREAENLGMDRSFLIYDDGDQLSLVRRAIREAGIELASVSPREMLSRIDAEKNAGRLPGQLPVAGDPRLETAQKVYRKYQQLLRAANAVDFGDLLLLLVELLRTNENVRAHYQRRFQHVLVDEFQDTNPVQYELLQLLAPPPKSNVVVVGDDDQSIYRWRGAEVDNILGFPTVYPGCKVVKLEQNYRSDQTILEAAHAVISKNRRRMDKKLWSARAKGEPLGLILARDERGEAQEVAARVHDLRREGICDFEQMAVFFRTNAQSRVLEETFRLLRVPYVLVSGRSFYDRAEIRDAASYLRLMVNPKSDADLSRVINTPARGIGDTTVERLTEYAAQQGGSLFEALAAPERITGMGGAAVKRLKAFREVVDALVAFAGKSPDATSAARFMLERTGLVAAHQQEGTEESLGRAENLKELLTATQEFDRQREERLAAAGHPLPPIVPLPEGPDAPGTPEPEPEETEPSPQGDLFAGFSAQPVAVTEAEAPPEAEPEATGPAASEALLLEVEAPPLQSFLEQISLVGEADGDTGVGKGRVSLMTLHAAKGLEFDAVFITGMEEEIFPHRRAIVPEATAEDMAEERRLCYVGFTRARRRLFTSLAQSRALFGEQRFNAPSRFLGEVPSELYGLSPDDAMPTMDRPSMGRPPILRRRGDDEGPVIDRTYDQSGAFHQGQDGDVRGMRVHHGQFGRGVVVSVSGRGPTAKLTVRFDHFGVKTVVARFLSPG
ncbi:MAG: UvrD-helicase domain-containing protein [Myxococcales bacterium]|nr:UvrD-helicase domain-containing protein [Myxococcales bacterium]